MNEVKNHGEKNIMGGWRCGWRGKADKNFLMRNTKTPGRVFSVLTKKGVDGAKAIDQR